MSGTPPPSGKPPAAPTDLSLSRKLVEVPLVDSNESERLPTKREGVAALLPATPSSHRPAVIVSAAAAGAPSPPVGPAAQAARPKPLQTARKSFPRPKMNSAAPPAEGGAAGAYLSQEELQRQMILSQQQLKDLEQPPLLSSPVAHLQRSPTTVARSGRLLEETIDLVAHGKPSGLKKKKRKEVDADLGSLSKAPVSSPAGLTKVVASSPDVSQQSDALDNNNDQKLKTLESSTAPPPPVEKDSALVNEDLEDVEAAIAALHGEPPAAASVPAPAGEEETLKEQPHQTLSETETVASGSTISDVIEISSSDDDGSSTEDASSLCDRASPQRVEMVHRRVVKIKKERQLLQSDHEDFENNSSETSATATTPAGAAAVTSDTDQSLPTLVKKSRGRPTSPSRRKTSSSSMSSPPPINTPSAKGIKRRKKRASPVSSSVPRVGPREVANLFIDEGAVNIISEMALRGDKATRRKGSTNGTSCLIPEELLPGATVENLRQVSETMSERKLKQLREPVPIPVVSPHKSCIRPQHACKPSPLATGSFCSSNKGVSFPEEEQTPPGSLFHSSDSEWSPNDLQQQQPKPKKIKLSSTSSDSDFYTPASSNNCSAKSELDSSLNESKVVGGGQGRSRSKFDKFVNGCREILVRAPNDQRLAHVVLGASDATKTGTFNQLLLSELTRFLRFLKTQDHIVAVLVTSASPNFSTGIDLTLLTLDHAAARAENASNMVKLIRRLVTELAFCDKYLIAGIRGQVTGLAVTLLPYFDLVYAADDVTLNLPYLCFGQDPEGALIHTFQTLPGSSILINKLVFLGKAITASEAIQHGLIHEVIEADQFDQEILPVCLKLVNPWSQSVLELKRKLRASLRRDLPQAIEDESRLLLTSWSSDLFVARARAHVQQLQLAVAEAAAARAAAAAVEAKKLKKKNKKNKMPQPALS